MARTPRLVEDRREQIIDAAMRVFAQKGFTKATNKDIAREAGITPGLIYYYFESKDALLNAILEARSPLQVMSSLSPEVLALPPELFFRMVITRVLAIMEGEPMVGLIRVILPETIHNPEVASVPATLFQRVFGFLASYVETKIASGELRPVNASMMVQVLAGSLVAFILRRQVLRDPMALAYSQEQIVDAVLDTILNGILPC